jgi:transcriptional regulator with XRE-family HTH domain
MTTLTLKALRQYAGRTQVEAARLAGTTQGELSRLERRDDLLLSTLQGYVRALGGTVEVVVQLGSTRVTLAAPTPAAPSLEEVRHALATLRELERWVLAVTAGASAASARSRRAGFGEFSLLEHVCHLRDLEREAWAVRVEALRRGAVEELPDFDGERAAKQRHYQRAELAPAVRDLLRARAASLTVLGRLKPADFERTGSLEGVGPLTLGTLITRWAGHDVGHRVEMERLRAALGVGEARPGRRSPR